MTDSQRADMDANMPPPVSQFWAEAGEGLYTDYMKALRI